MAKRTGIRKIVYQDLLVKELNALEHRLDARMDLQVQSFKDYVDSKVTQLDNKTGLRFDRLERYFEELVAMHMVQNKKIDALGSRVDTLSSTVGTLSIKFDTLSEKVDDQGKRLDRVLDRLEQHDHRLTALETKH
jgi:outer membrane murein-binding lipoprotein Lpp